MPDRSKIALVGIGILSFVPYAGALVQGQFRPGGILVFFPAFFAAFVLYILAVLLILRLKSPESGSRQMLAIIFGFALVFNALLLPMRPTLSDDLYRYVWDGRVQ
ncbi:MAG TPA: hypothetical protein VKQ72_02875, partial [Aggregatilineales bacterium]|nr:hypothetical protein [Aggregatilineales bacterium]